MTDEQLVAAFARSRDESSFRALYRRHTPMLYALSLRLTCSPTDAEELVQQAWVRAVENLRRFERRSTFRTWLTGILTNCFREMMRRRASAPSSLDELPSTREPWNVEPIRRAHPVDVERAVSQLPGGTER